MSASANPATIAQREEERVYHSNPRKIKSIHDLKPGNHITYPREYVILELDHHAIVEKVDCSNGYYDIIESTGGLKKDSGQICTVRRTKKKYRLNQLIYVMEYRSLDVLDVEETIRKAKSKIGESNYDPFTNNCEHFARWCKTGKADCHQQTTDVLRRPIEVGTKFGCEAAITTSLMVFEKVPLSKSLAMGRFSNHAIKWGKTCLTKADKISLARNFEPLRQSAFKMKVGCNIAAVGVSSVIDGIQFVSSKKKNHELYKSKLITKAEYYARVGEDASKRTGGILFGSALGIVSQIVIPIPIVGGCLGGFCGDFLGRKLGKYIGKQIAWGG